MPKRSMSSDFRIPHQYSSCYTARMAPKKKIKALDFAGFAKLLSKAAKLGNEHKQEGRASATPMELMHALRVETGDVRATHFIQLMESYRAGYSF